MKGRLSFYRVENVVCEFVIRITCTCTRANSLCAYNHIVCFRAKIELGDVTPHNIKQLKLLNQVVFPVSYNEKFYKDVLEAGELAKLVYYNDIVVSVAWLSLYLM